MTKKNKILSAFLMVLLLFCTISLSFGASAASSTCTVYISVSGRGQVSNGSQSSSTRLELEYPAGSTVTLTATPGSGKELIYWLNTETDRALCFEETYSFTIGSSVYLQACFDLSEEAAAALNPPQHLVVYFTEGGNVLSNSMVPIGSTAYYASEIAPIVSAAYVDGKTWDGWDPTVEEVAAQSGRVFVYPHFSGAQSFTITTIVGDTVKTQQMSYGSTFYADAPASLNGESFSYWVAVADEYSADDVIASYNRRHGIVVVLPQTLRAVYGAPVNSGIVTRVLGETHDFDAGKITFYTERSLTGAYTVAESGLLFTRDVAIGNRVDQFVLDNVYEGGPINRGRSPETSLEGTYFAGISTWTTVPDEGEGGEDYTPLVFVRSYVVAREISTGNIITKYSPIFCADYVNRSFTRISQIMDNPFEDPFGD